MLNYDSLKQTTIFPAIVNVSGDLSLQKITLTGFFFSTYYVPDVLITYLYMLSLALIILLSLFLYVEKRLFRWKLFSHLCRGKD